MQLPVLTPRRPLKESQIAEGKGLSKQTGMGTFCHPTLCPTPFSPSSPREGGTYPSPQDLVDGRAFLQRALSDDLCSHFLHIQHECIKRFLYVGLLLLFLLFGVLMLSGCRQSRQTQPNKQLRGPASSTAQNLSAAAHHPHLAAWNEKHTSTFGLFHPGKWNKNSPRRSWGMRAGVVITSSSFTNTQCFPGQREKRPVVLSTSGSVSCL